MRKFPGKASTLLIWLGKSLQPVEMMAPLFMVATILRGPYRERKRREIRQRPPAYPPGCRTSYPVWSAENNSYVCTSSIFFTLEIHSCVLLSDNCSRILQWDHKKSFPPLPAVSIHTKSDFGQTRGTERKNALHPESAAFRKMIKGENHNEQF